ncbi:MAG: flagellar hook-basal body complex protein [Candidatus Melainabacteria bacterium]
MTQGLFTAVSGIRANQTRMDVISNNIANVNTVGFKSSSVNFATVFSRTVSGGTAPNGLLGGTNPRQVGSGVFAQEIAANHNAGGTQFTGRNTDLMVQGEGFFAIERIDVNSGNTSTDFYLTRAGNFSLDSDGNLVSASGNRVRGSSLLNGSTTASLGRINIPLEFQIYKGVDVNNNVINSMISPLGTSQVQMDTDYLALYGVAAPGSIVSSVELRNFTIGTDGSIMATYSNGDRITVRSDPTATGQREIIHLPFEGGTYSFTGGDPQDAGQTGQVADRRVFDGGTPDVLATGGEPMEGMQMQIQMATVVNPQGLLYDGNNNFLISANSGSADFGVPGSGAKGSILSGALESSNVDIAGEFSNMIITQRGIEAASRVVRSQSEILQTIINNTV